MLETSPSRSAKERRFRVSAHVSVCYTSDYAVLLDSRSSRYVGIPMLTAIALEIYVSGWPASPGASASEICHDTHDCIDELLSAGLISESYAYTPTSPLCSDLPPPRRALIDGYTEDSVRFTLPDAFRFAGAVLVAAYFVRLRAICFFVRRVRARRERRKLSGSVTLTAEVADLVSRFDRLFLTAFSASDNCLFHSAALCEYLAYHSVFPRFVLGVATNPFGAHCWLQEGDTVVNDEPAHAGNYVPILVA